MFGGGSGTRAEDENDGAQSGSVFKRVPNLFRRCNLESNSVFRICFHVFMFPAGFQVLLCTTFTFTFTELNYNTSSSSS